jgi:hypothetical protein
MNIVKPNYQTIRSLVYLLNYEEVLESLLDGYEVKQDGDMLIHRSESWNPIYMFVQEYKGQKRYQLSGMMDKVRLNILYDTLSALYPDEPIIDMADEPFYAFDKKEIHISVTDTDVVIHHTELDCLVFDIVNGI